MESNQPREELLEILENVYDYDKPWMENLELLGAKLSREISKEPPWGARYMNSLLREHKNITFSTQLQEAIRIKLARLDGQNEIQIKLKGPVSVYCTNGLQDGDIVLGHPQYCLRPGCRIRFVRKAPNQKYCCSGCRVLDYKETKKPRAGA